MRCSIIKAGRIGGLLILVAVITLALTMLHVKACFNPYDLYAYEILMNKPGVEFDIEKLKQISLEWDSKYVRISTVDYRVLIMVYPVDLEKLNLGKEVAYSIRFQLRPEYVGKKTFVVICVVKKAQPISEEMVSNKSELIIIRKTYVKENEKYMEAAEVTAININPEESLSVFVDRVLEYAALKFKVSKGEVEVVNAYETTIKPINVETDIPWCNVVSEELAYLSSKEIIKGLTTQDIETLAKLAKPGLAGWNSRIVFENSWKPYYETSNPLLIRAMCAPEEIESITRLESLLETMWSKQAYAIVLSSPSPTPTALPTPAPAMPSVPATPGYEALAEEKAAAKEILWPGYTLAQVAIGGFIAALIVWFILRKIAI